MKALKKNDTLVQVATLKLKKQILEKENWDLIEYKKNNIESILLLEETVKILETRSPHVEKTSTETQLRLNNVKIGNFLQKIKEI